MVRVAQAGLTVPAVAGQLERGGRPHAGARAIAYVAPLTCSSVM